MSAILSAMANVSAIHRYLLIYHTNINIEYDAQIMFQMLECRKYPKTLSWALRRRQWCYDCCQSFEFLTDHCQRSINENRSSRLDVLFKTRRSTTQLFTVSKYYYITKSTILDTSKIINVSLLYYACIIYLKYPHLNPLHSFKDLSIHRDRQREVMFYTKLCSEGN